MTDQSRINAIIQAVQSSEPITPLTDNEIIFILETVESMSREEVLARLQSDLQTACEIELATIPIYLFTYYSLFRTQSNGLELTDEAQFINSSAAQIMSVAVEEMLHMSLSANIYFSLFGESPSLYGKSPGNYPTPLPYHNPVGIDGPEGTKDAAVAIPLGKLSYEQLWHFLQIEYPEARDAVPKDRDWDTIGQFYSYLRCLMCSSQLLETDFQVGAAHLQIQPYNYAPNNIDTVSPSKKFNLYIPPSQPDSAAEVATFSNQPDSHAGKVQLMTVSTRLDAMLAVDTICDQGEGFNYTAYDDPSDQETSHFYKFLTIQAQFEQYQNRVEVLPDMPTPPDPVMPTMSDSQLVTDGYICNFPINPKVATYTNELETAVANFCNGLYQYMLIMTETIFKVPAEPSLPTEKQTQKWYFNVALHRSMIWVLDKFIQTMRKIELQDTQGNVTGEYLAPTFEFINLGSPQEAFESLKNLGNKAIAASANHPQGSDIQYYVDVAVNKMSGSESMHLPDVKDFL